MPIRNRVIPFFLNLDCIFDEEYRKNEAFLFDMEQKHIDYYLSKEFTNLYELRLMLTMLLLFTSNWPNTAVEGAKTNHKNLPNLMVVKNPEKKRFFSKLAQDMHQRNLDNQWGRFNQPDPTYGTMFVSPFDISLIKSMTKGYISAKGGKRVKAMLDYTKEEEDVEKAITCKQNPTTPIGKQVQSVGLLLLLPFSFLLFSPRRLFIGQNVLTNQVLTVRRGLLEM